MKKRYQYSLIGQQRSTAIFGTDPRQFGAAGFEQLFLGLLRT